MNKSGFLNIADYLLKIESLLGAKFWFTSFLPALLFISAVMFHIGSLMGLQSTFIQVNTFLTHDAGYITMLVLFLLVTIVFGYVLNALRPSFQRWWSGQIESKLSPVWGIVNILVRHQQHRYDKLLKIGERANNDGEDLLDYIRKTYELHQNIQALHAKDSWEAIIARGQEVLVFKYSDSALKIFLAQRVMGTINEKQKEGIENTLRDSVNFLKTSLSQLGLPGNNGEQTKLDTDTTSDQENEGVDLNSGAKIRVVDLNPDKIIQQLDLNSDLDILKKGSNDVLRHVIGSNLGIQKADSMLSGLIKKIKRWTAHKKGESRLALYKLDRQFDTNNALYGTQLGNIIESSNTYSFTRYSIEGEIIWPRLQPVLPDQLKKQLSSSRAYLDFALSMASLGILFALCILFVQPLWLSPITTSSFFWIAGGLTCAVLFYYLAVEAGRQLGEVIRTGFDMHRRDLLKKMNLSVPNTLKEERLLWEKLSELIVYGNRLTSLTFNKAES